MLPRFAPMLATTDQQRVRSGAWAFEPKLDGWRALTYVDASGVTVLSRRGKPLTDSVPQLAGLTGALGGRTAVLDGELVAGDGRPGAFYGLAGDLSRRTGGKAMLAAFDVLWLDGEDLTGRPYSERRQALVALGLTGPSWLTVPSFVGDVEDVGRVCIEHGLEGMVAKRLDGRYRPGQRSGAWVKFKTVEWRVRHAPNRHGVTSKLS